MLINLKFNEIWLTAPDSFRAFSVLHILICEHKPLISMDCIICLIIVPFCWNAPYTVRYTHSTTIK